MTPDELEQIALTLEAQASVLRHAAGEARRRTFALVPSATDDKPAQRSNVAATNFFAETLDAFRAVWQAAHGQTYIVHPRDRKALGTLMKGMVRADADQLPAMFARYLCDSDPFVMKSAHSLSLFCNQVNRYRTEVTGGKGDDLEIFR